MARLARLCIPDCPHLLLQQGHNRQPVFADDVDRQQFLSFLQSAASAERVAIHAYALMDEEVRLLATPVTSEGLSRMMQAIGRLYGASFNRRHGRSGSVWNGRFRATVVEPERHLLDCMRYVEASRLGSENGTASGQADWTSASHHLGRRVDPIVGDHLRYWSLGNTPFEREAAYAILSQQALTSVQELTISNAVRKGWPLGSVEFVASLTDKTKRRLVPRSRGRPPKALDN